MWGKVVASMFVLVGTQGFGVALSQEMKCIIYHLNEQKQMLFYITREIDFLHRPMQEIFISISERLQKPYDLFVRNIAQKMDNDSGRGLLEIWNEEVDDLEKNTCYPKKTFLFLREMRRCFCCEDEEMQKQSFEMLRSELEDEMQKLRRGKDERDRLIKTLSLLAGIVCIVIFI